MIQPALEALQD